MNPCDIDKIKNAKNLIIMSQHDYCIKDSIEFSFGNVIDFNSIPTDSEIREIINFINKKVRELVIINFDDIYRKILPHIKKSVNIKCIYTHNLAKMTDGNIRAIFYNILEFYDRDIIAEIGCIDKSTFKVLENSKYKVKHILLDVDDNNDNKYSGGSKTIGILGNDYDPNHNIYNLLGAVRLVDYSNIKIIKHMPATEHFLQFFDIKEQTVETIDEVMKNNFINLYVNFTETMYTCVLKSMDIGIPCLLGNTDIFDDYSLLKKFLVLNSDDDINEIAQKISDIQDEKNLKLIQEQYKTFRKRYIELSSKSIKSFIEK